MPKKYYSRDEKIDYYIAKIASMREYLAWMEQRLSYLQSDSYQDWSSELSKQVKSQKKGKTEFKKRFA